MILNYKQRNFNCVHIVYIPKYFMLYRISDKLHTTLSRAMLLTYDCWECIQKVLHCLHFVVTSLVLPSGTICCAHGTVPQMFGLLNYTLSSPICQTCYIKLFMHVLYLASRHWCSLLHLHSQLLCMQVHAFPNSYSL